MAEEYPFPVPESTFVNIDKRRTPLWKRYADGWTPDNSWPLVINALQRLETRLVALNASLDLIVDHCQNCSCDGSVDAVWGVHHTLADLIRDFDELLCVARETLPSDPVMRRWIADADRTLTTV